MLHKAVQNAVDPLGKRLDAASVDDLKCAPERRDDACKARLVTLVRSITHGSRYDFFATISNSQLHALAAWRGAARRMGHI